MTYQNNIITMSPIKFLNTFCSNNPTLEQVASFIQSSDYAFDDLNKADNDKDLV